MNGKKLAKRKARRTTFEPKSDNQAESRDHRPTEEEIRAWLVSNIAELVEVDAQQIDTHLQFDSYGMDSLQSAQLSGDLEEWLGRRLSPTVVWDYPSVELLSKYLSSEDGNSSPSVTAFQDDEDGGL